MLVCPRCFGHSDTLSAHFNEQANVGDCPTCGSRQQPLADAASLLALFAGLKAMYEPLCGDPYRIAKHGIQSIGASSGDEELTDVLRGDWEVFSDLIDDASALRILEEVWPQFTGDYTRVPGSRWRRVQQETNELRTRVIRGDADSHALSRIIDPWLECLCTRLDRRSWYRARIQTGRGASFPLEHMGAPPEASARAGRGNLDRVSVLYVASDALTTIAEVRAEPGQWVTVATIELSQRPLTVLDLSRDIRIIDPFAHADLDGALMARALLDSFRGEMCRPISRGDEKREYRMTQAVAEYFKSNGFDGVLFPSSVAAGSNAMFFDPTAGTATSTMERVVWKKSLDVLDAADYDRELARLRGVRH